jgi:hypothetical protein
MNITLDTVTPTISKTYPPNTSEIAFVNVSNVTFNFSVNDSTSGIYNITLYVYQNNSSSSNFCYQEFANQSWLTDSNCSLDYTGGYKEAIVSGPAMTNGYDGDYNTMVFPTFPSNGDLFINYTKPFGALDTSVWQIKKDFVTNISNYTIPSACWDTSNNSKLQFKVHMANDGFSCKFYHYCYNDTGWYEIIETLGGGCSGRFWEEGMFWDITDYSLINNTTKQ